MIGVYSHQPSPPSEFGIIPVEWTVGKNYLGIYLNPYAGGFDASKSLHEHGVQPRPHFGTQLWPTEDGLELVPGYVHIYQGNSLEYEKMVPTIDGSALVDALTSDTTLPVLSGSTGKVYYKFTGTMEQSNPDGKTWKNVKRFKCTSIEVVYEEEPEDTDCVRYLEIGETEVISDGVLVKYYLKGDHVVNFYQEAACGGGSSSGSDSQQPSSSTAPSDSGSPSGSGSSSGGPKSSAIVPCSYHDLGYAAWFTVEAPEVLFVDFVKVHNSSRQRELDIRIDPAVVEACVEGSLQVVDSSGRFEVFGEYILYTAPLFKWSRPKEMVIQLVGVRKGFDHVRNPPRSQKQFEQNETFLNSAYDRQP